MTTLAAVAALALTAGCDGSSGQSGPDSEDVASSLRHNVMISVRKARDTMIAVESGTFVVTGDPKRAALAKGTMAFGEDQLAAAFTVPGKPDAKGKDTRLDARLLGAVLYTEIPERERASQEGRSWAQSDLSSGEVPTTNASAVGAYLGIVDPLHQLQVLLTTSDVSVTGPDEISNATTVRYSATLPLASYLSRVNPNLRPVTERHLASNGNSEVRINVWVDTKYQTRRCRLVTGDFDITVNYREFGKSVIVKAPPAADTVGATG